MAAIVPGGLARGQFKKMRLDCNFFVVLRWYLRRRLDQER